MPPKRPSLIERLPPFRTELLRGAAFSSDAPTPLHQFVVGRLLQLAGTDSAPWWILPSPAVSFFSSDTLFVPDLAGWQTRLLPSLPNRLSCTPNWVCEVITDDGRYERGPKLDYYRSSGVQSIWIVDVTRREIEEHVGTGVTLLPNPDRSTPFDAPSFDRLLP